MVVLRTADSRHHARRDVVEGVSLGFMARRFGGGVENILRFSLRNADRVGEPLPCNEPIANGLQLASRVSVGHEAGLSSRVRPFSADRASLPKDLRHNSLSGGV